MPKYVSSPRPLAGWYRIAKKKIRRADFIAAFSNAHLEHRQQLNIFAKMEKSLPLWDECIAQSFITKELKDSYRALLRSRFDRIA